MLSTVPTNQQIRQNRYKPAVATWAPSGNDTRRPAAYICMEIDEKGVFLLQVLGGVPISSIALCFVVLKKH